MVRYGKLSFRQTVSKYDVQITTSPMMLSVSLSASLLLLSFHLSLEPKNFLAPPLLEMQISAQT